MKSVREPTKKRRGGPRTDGRLQRALDDTARREIAAALAETDGNSTAAADVLGISRRALYKRAQTLGIDMTRYRR